MLWYDHGVYHPTFFGMKLSELPWEVFEVQVFTLLALLAIGFVVARVKGKRTRGVTLAFVVPWCTIEALKLAVFLLRHAF